MVCRENKARSAFMGWVKHMLRQAGYGDYSDHEVQSMIHEQQHRYADMGPTNSHEYVAFLKGFRQQALDDSTLSHNDKFRPSRGRASQPGLITRVDEELERFRTGSLGTDSNGNPIPLTRAQMNVGANFAAMQRLLQPVADAQQAKDAYFEIYARHMGLSQKQASARFRELVDKPKADRLNTKIRLTDGWRDNLAIAGLNTEQQSAMGQSNRTREALRIMEAERQAKIATYPTRPAVRSEHRIPLISAEDATIQCEGGCGQFGHTADQCPNTAEVTAAAAATAELDTATADLRQQERYALAANYTALANADQPVGDEGADGKRYVVDPVTGEQQEVTPARQAQWAEDGKRLNKAALKRAKKRQVAAVEAAEAADAALDAARGPIPLVSSWIEKAAYNPDNGTLLIRTKERRLKRGGTTPGKTYLRRVGPEAYAKMLSGESLGSGVSATVFAREAQGGSERYRAANPGEEKEMLRERQCPSCGQFASFTQDHRCPISTDADNRAEHIRAIQERENLERAEVAKLPVKVVDSAPRTRITAKVSGRFAENSRMAFPNPQQSEAAIREGKVALGDFNATYLGQQVRGEVATWADKRTGQHLYRVSRMQCSCGQKQCRHADMAAAALAEPYSAQRSYGSPGAPLVANTAKPAANTVDNDPDTRSYEQIQKIRAANSDRQVARFNSGAEKRVHLLPPTVHGMPVTPQVIPTQWTGAGTPVDVNDAGAVRDSIVAMLNTRTGRDPEASNWKVTTDGDGGVWVRSAEIAHPVKHRAGMTTQHQRELAAAFGLSDLPGGRGVYVPGTPAWRHEMLDRLAGTDSGIKGGRYGPRYGDDARD